MGRTRKRPSPDLAPNPLRWWPPNEPCFCSRPRLAKDCCLLNQPVLINAEDARTEREAMARGAEGRQAIRFEFERHRIAMEESLREKVKDMNKAKPAHPGLN